MNTRIASLFFVTISIAILTGCASPGMRFAGQHQDGGEHDFSPLPRQFDLDYHEWSVKKFGRDAQRADLAYMKAARIGEQFANLKRKFMSEGLSETQANYVIRTQYLSKLDPDLRRMVAVQMGYTGFSGNHSTGGTHFYPSGSSFSGSAGVGGRPSNMRVGTTPHRMDVIQP